MTAALGGTIRERLRNQPDGFAGLDSNGDLLGTLINRSMTYAELIGGVIPEVGEIVYCTDTRDVHIGDGSTVGGLFLHSPVKFVTPTLNVQNTTTTDSVIATMPVKSGCEYNIKALLTIIDTDFSSNNVIIRLARNSAGVTEQARVHLPVWRSLDQPYYTGTTSDGNTFVYAPPATPVFHFTHFLLLNEQVLSSADVNVTLDFRQAVASASYALINGAKITIQRVA